MRVGILGGGPSGEPNEHHIRRCDKTICMNASIQIIPFPDAYCVADPRFIDANRDAFETLAFTECEIFQGVVTDHPDGYASKPLCIGETSIHYGMADALYHGRTVGVMAIRIAIQHFGATEIVIAGIDGYGADSKLAKTHSPLWCEKINEHAAMALAMLKVMHPSVVWTWCEGAGKILKPIIERKAAMLKDAISKIEG